MAKTTKDRIHFITAALEQHNVYWDRQRPEMRRYRNAYMTEFYKDSQYQDPASLRVETADAYATIESVMGSLFTRYPGIEVAYDIEGKGDLVVARELVNSWIASSRTQIENAARMALIFPQAFFKLAPRESSQLNAKVALRAIPPWQIIVDQDAAAWEDSRYVGHSYYISVDEAKSKFGNKDFKGCQQKDYIDDGKETQRTSSTRYQGGDTSELPNEYLYIEIVEIYDFINDELLFWSPQWKNGQELLSRDPIPVRTYDGRPLSNIIPLYFSRHPERPMIGYSAMRRVYDQVFEKNVMRTFWANAVRRDSRQYIYKEGAFDEDALAKISSGVDGVMVPVDNDTLNGLIEAVPVTPMSSNFDQYLAMVESDLQKGSLTAGFTRGETTKATATEISVLQQYTSSELGKLARERDVSLEAAATLYLRMLLPLIDEKDPQVVVSTDGPKIVTPESIDADWRMYATDGGATPMSDAIKKQTLLQVLPALTQLGVPVQAIREEMVRLFNLPETFLEEAPAQAPAQPSPVAGPAPTPESASDISSLIGGV